jgi:2-polyprenyl-6-methoxyphenol hydroxylase-like FAD-dependent oxidoreductase
LKALIVGAGPGGLACALHLSAAGFDCEVFEAASEIKPLGVGLNLLPHAVRELTVLRLDGKLAAASVATAELGYYTRRGTEIWREPRGLAAGYKWPQYSIHRGKLQSILLDEVERRLGPSGLHTAHQLVTFRDDGHGVSARFSDPTDHSLAGEYRGDILVGADGIHSFVRKCFYPDEIEPLYSGRVLWRATTAAPPFLTGRSMIMAGYSDRKFVAYPISHAQSGRSLINWVADVFIGGDSSPVPRDWNRRTDCETVLEPFRDWRFPWLDIPALIEGAEAIYEYPLVDRDPIPRWSFGRVTLLGDAAHPMYPVGSNGASQAILDAAALTSALTAHSDPTAALQFYEAQRSEKTARLVLSNRQQGPEIVMQMVEDRAPEGFTQLSDVISREELEEVANRYKAVAGFDREYLNALSSAGT